MFAVVRTGGKQYRVAPGDKIVVEKLAGEAGDSHQPRRRPARRRRLGPEVDRGPQGRRRDHRPGEGGQGHGVQEAPPPQLPPQGRPSPAADDPQDRRDRRPEGREEAAKPAAEKAPRPRPLRLLLHLRRKPRLPPRRLRSRPPSPLRRLRPRPKSPPRRPLRPRRSRQRMLHLLRPRPRSPEDQQEVVRDDGT